MKVNLLPADLRAQLPPLYAQDGNPNAIAYVKFFTPDSNWTWYGCEFDGEDILYGLVQGFEEEMGYFSLSELQNFRSPRRLPIERDLHFKPTLISQLRKR